MIYIVFTICIVYIVMLFFAGYFCNYFPADYYKGSSHFNHSENRIFIIELAILALSVYLYLLLSIITTHGDSGSFAVIIKGLVEEPFLGFYDRAGFSYPPLFNYLYFIIGKIMQLTGTPFDYRTRAFLLLLKLPAIICEFLMAALLYRQARKRLRREQTIPVLVLILLNPGYLFITAYISQIDALYVFFMLLTLSLMADHRLKASFFAFGAAFLFKFQAVFITPVIAYAVIQQVFLQDFNWKKFWTSLLSGLAAIACMVLSYMPFIFDFRHWEFTNAGLTGNFNASIKSFGLASQNTYNFWTLIGYNWHYETEKLGFFSCTTWGTIFIVLLVILATALFAYRRKDEDVLPLLGALLVTGTCCFAVRMMPRYLYPAVALLIIGYILKPTLLRFACVIIYSVLFFLETAFDYLIYPQWEYSTKLILPRIISAALLAGFGFLVYVIIRERRRGERPQTAD